MGAAILKSIATNVLLTHYSNYVSKILRSWYGAQSELSTPITGRLELNCQMVSGAWIVFVSYITGEHSDLKKTHMTVNKKRNMFDCFQFIIMFQARLFISGDWCLVFVLTGWSEMTLAPVMSPLLWAKKVSYSDIASVKLCPFL